MLLHFPAAAAALPAPLSAALAAIDEPELPGISTLRELLDALRANSARSTAQLLEEWRERPEAKRLGALYAEPTLLDATQARAEFRGLLARLSEQVSNERSTRRYDELLARVNSRSASAEELREFQTLLTKVVPPG
jgi:hypothetical protein